MNPVPFLWLAAVVGFLLLEASTFSMTSVWFAVGAAAALLTCLFTDSFRAQALVFIVVSILCLLAFRPLAAKLRQKITPTNGDRNLGREATVLTTVTADRGDASGLLSLWESGNGYFYSTAYDMLLRAADASGHVEVRDAYLEDAEAMLVEDSWVIPLYYVHRHSGLAQQLTAPLYDGTGVYRFSAVVRQTPQ